MFPDAYTVLGAAVGNNVDIPEIRGTNSFVRVVPLLLATALCGLAFILGIIVDCSFDTTTRSWMQWFHAGIVLGSAAMIAIGFGYTQQEYTNGIRAACEQLDGRCASLDFGLEFILLVVGLCLMALAFLILLYYLPFGKTSEDGLHQKKKMSSVAMTQPHQNSSYGSSSEDALEAWRDAAAAMIDEQQQQESWHDYGMKGSLPPPPPQHSRHSSPLQQTRLSPPTRRRYSVQPENSRRYRRTTQGNSYMYNDGEELAPPSLPFAPSSPHERTRRTSQGSANTFGANNIMARNSRTSSMMDEFHDSRTTTTPTSMKPHPDTDSFCITPVERSSGGSYDSVGQQQRRRSSTPLDPLQRRQRRRSSSPFHDIRHVPRLNMPPAAVHDVHPLNHKVITDKRISAYLQQRQQF